MAYTAIDDPEAYFQVQLYTGNGSANNAITLGGDTDMQPDLVWIKNRDATDAHCLFDSVRGATKVIHSDTTGAETTDADTLDSFTSDGFQVDADVKVNTNTEKYVAWCWKESATAGFDILTYTGNATNRTISHNLSAVPQVVIVKRRDAVTAWSSLHLAIGDSTDRMVLNDSAALEDDATMWQDTDPTSSVFSLGTSSSTNVNTGTYVAYLWAPIQGFSKFGTYEGNNNADGTFVYTGFSVAYVLVKNIDASGPKWTIQDTKRSPSLGGNPAEARLHPNDTTVEEADSDIDLLSNGFKIRSTGSYTNDAETYIYMAFAEAPFVNSNGVPCNAV